MKSTKDDIKEITTKYVFDSITDFNYSDASPVPLFLSRRKTVDVTRYGFYIDLFDGTPEPHYDYFFNLEEMPAMSEYYLNGRNKTGYCNYVLTLTEAQRNSIVSISTLYFGFIARRHARLCKLFLKEDFQGIISEFQGAFKKLPGDRSPSELCFDDIKNIFGMSPNCCHLRPAWKWGGAVDDSVDFNTFKANVQNMCTGNLISVGRRKYYAHRGMSSDRLVLNKFIAVNELEIEFLNEALRQYMPKVQHSFLMLGYAFHTLGLVPKDSEFYSEFKSEESVQCQSQPEAVTCSSSQEEHQSDQQ